ncbi:phage tail tape measure protein [Lacticaseibacillus paracasei]|uniref:Minor tail protein gp26-like n=1 Tax=Lacticaseibacillus paracasei NRIC 0644 TaxID=1435038 RepID=A0A0C9NZK0_LACPA|nr:phage tail tape measure protein [Lacticaseibacillus paracasei]GAN37500.1 minor tail protein gp26-like [Lacticaseibacillus paracasei NRIC 0644]GAN38158.1 minor tail protein gp26-like [Lacticaseibacillus paracasei NRIC 1917]
MADSYSVEAILSAVDKNFSGTFENMSSVVNSAVDSISSGLASLGKYTAVAGAAVTAMGVQSLKSFGTFEASLNKAAVVAGGTSKNIGELADVANKMGAELPLSAQDAADAMVQMAQDGANLDTIKDEFPAIAKAATAAGADLQATAGTVQVAMNIWGDSIGSSAQAAAVLTETANVSNATIEEMQQAFADVGSIASSVGFSMQDTSTAIGLVSNAGVPAAQAAQDLNYALTRIIKPSKAASEMASSLGISYYDAQGKMRSLPDILGQINKATSGLTDEQKQLALTTMYGTAGFKAMGPLLKGVASNSDNASQSWTAMSKAINDASSSAQAANAILDQQASDMQNNIGSKIEQVGGNWEALRNTAMQANSGINSSILNMVNNVLTMADDSNTSLGQMAQSFIGLSTVIGPAMTGFAGFAAQANAVRNFLGLGSKEASGFSKALSGLTDTSKISTVFDGMNSKVRGFVSATQSAPRGISNFVSALKGVEQIGPKGFESLSSGMQKVVGFTANASTQVKAFGGGIGSLASSVASKFPAMSATVSSFSSTFKKGLSMSAIGNPFGELPSMISSSLSSMTSAVSSKLAPLSGLFSKLGTGISSGLSTSFDIGTSIVSNGMTAIAGVMKMGLSVIAPAAIIATLIAGLGVVNNQFGTQIQAMLQTATTQGPQIITNFVSGIVSAIPQLIASGESLVTSLLNAITANLPTIITGGVQIITTLVSSLTSGSGSANMLNAAITMITTLVTGLVGALPQLMSAGINLIMALINAIVQNLPMLIDAAMQMIQTLATGLLQNMDQIINGALQIVDGLVDGISQNLPAILNAALEIIVAIVSGLVQHIDQLIDAALKLITALANALIDNLPMIINAAIKLIMALMNGLIDNLDKIIDAGIKIILAIQSALIQNQPKLIKAAITLITTLAGALVDNLPKILAAGVKLVVGLAKGLWDHRDDLVDAGGQLIMGLVKGIGNLAAKAWNAAVSVAKGIVDKVKGALGIHSPSKVMAQEVGQYIPAGVAVGITDNMKPITKAVDAMKAATAMSIPAIDTSAFSSSVSALNSNVQGATLSSNLDVNYTRKQTIEVPIYIDSREVARATANPMQTELSRMTRMSNRRKGLF